VEALLEVLAVADLEGGASGLLRNLVEQLGVDREVAAIEHRAAEQVVAGLHRRVARATHQDRVDLDAERARELGRLARRHVAAVGVAVGREDDHAALGRRLAQPVDRDAEAVADRGAAPVDHAELEAADHRAQRLVVGRQRQERVRVAAEDHAADAVVRAAADEVIDDVLGGVEAVGLDVGRLHRQRQIEREHDVDAVDVGLVARVDALRPHQREGHAADRQHAHPGQRRREPQPIAG
jgi:hypothetical protein